MGNSVVDTATAALRDLMARGRYEPGDRLPPERELADGLGLSRPALREAVRQLTAAGLLEPRRGSGTYVASVDLEAVFAVRLQLEPYAAGEAARRRTADEVGRLETLLDRLSAELDTPEAFAATDLELHHTIAEASRNPVLLDMLARLTELARLSRAITSPRREARTATLRDLRALVGAINDRDATGAEQAMRRHLEAMLHVARKASTLHRRDRTIRPSLPVAAEPIGPP